MVDVAYQMLSFQGCSVVSMFQNARNNIMLNVPVYGLTDYY